MLFCIALRSVRNIRKFFFGWDIFRNIEKNSCTTTNNVFLICHQLFRSGQGSKRFLLYSFDFPLVLIISNSGNIPKNGTINKSFSRSDPNQKKHFYCAKRSLRPWDSQNWVFRVSVRSSVRSFVSILSDFYQKKYGGSQMPLNSEVLKHRFQNFLQKKGRSVYISAK